MPIKNLDILYPLLRTQFNKLQQSEYTELNHLIEPLS